MNFRCKRVIKFLRRLKEAHLRFLDFKNLKILKSRYAHKQLQICPGQFDMCDCVLGLSSTIHGKIIGNCYLH